METTVHHWQKSSFSGDSSNCLYLAADAKDTILIRESDDPRRTIVATSSAALAGLLCGIRGDTFGRA
ncbi:DUF397 domain-containing protein [Streptomyces halobius]|uniref:DUF397 domain-containing protein n=1 Tax=Streptomyces halobius TaxID=2879846 RepID=A0ABY4M881_9ACTN|nr:DUF397 domain-containing protein [Streptomyces halobius]UQA93572.1 DUF397 domain-containing protein [Streptomyces halobius]